jgi:HAD superfamily hydrolase (TIGR01490 family)
MDLIFSEDRNQAAKTAAFFDLDRTIIARISGQALVQTAWEKGLIKIPDVLRASLLYIMYRINIRDALSVIDDMTGWVKGKTVGELNDLCDITSENVLLPSVYPEARAAINMHRNSGRPAVILSSALDRICQNIACELKMDDYICSSLGSADGLLTGKPSGRICFGPEKLTRLTGYCRAENIDLSGSWYYSDAISDLPVFEAAGHPVCVNPDRALRKEGMRRGWTILDWHN